MDVVAVEEDLQVEPAAVFGDDKGGEWLPFVDGGADVCLVAGGAAGAVLVGVFVGGAALVPGEVVPPGVDAGDVAGVEAVGDEAARSHGGSVSSAGERALIQTGARGSLDGVPWCSAPADGSCDLSRPGVNRPAER